MPGFGIPRNPTVKHDVHAAQKNVSPVEPVSYQVVLPTPADRVGSVDLCLGCAARCRGGYHHPGGHPARINKRHQSRAEFFCEDGWRVTDQYDSIYWHIPSTSMGAVEWDVRGLYPDESRPELGDASDLFHMYDYTFHDSDSNYSPGYRGNPYKHLVRKQGNLDLAPNRMKVVYKIGEPFFEEGTAAA